MERFPEDIGICKVDKDGGIITLERKWYGQGAVFKSWDAYHNRPADPCYVPELSDTVYTAQSFLELCNDQQEFADELFDGVDWQHPESLMEDWLREDEWIRCPGCGNLVNYGSGFNDTTCPECGRKIGEENSNG